MQTARTADYDAVVIGAGFAGIYMLYRLRDTLGLAAHVFEESDGVGGTWNLNRYPGARCDSESHVYCYSFSKELLRDWQWSSRYPEHDEIRAYLNHVTDRFDLRRDISFDTRVARAAYDDASGLWQVTTGAGQTVTARFLITGLGLLSAARHIPRIPGLEGFGGEWHHTSDWPREPVDFSGKRVGVIGTGSTGAQVVAAIADKCAQLSVFQRSPQYVLPARNRPNTPEFQAWLDSHYDEVWQAAQNSTGGYPYHHNRRRALEETPEQIRQTFDELWQVGGFKFVWGSYMDLIVDHDANRLVADYVRARMAETIRDPEVARRLLPTDHPLGGRRPVVNDGYLEAFNRDNVHLVDLREAPITRFTATGIQTTDAHHDLDMVIFATGFDAVTGPFLRIDIRGRGGLPLRDKWAGGPATAFGLATSGFPNMFMISGPGSMFGNQPVTIEHHANWIADCIAHLDAQGLAECEVRPRTEQDWSQQILDWVQRTVAAETDSWWNGSNIPGKKRTPFFYTGSFSQYKRACDQAAEQGYPGFDLRPALEEVQP